MLVKPTVAELLEKGENRYRLVIATAKRARQISSGSERLIETEDTAPVTIAAGEIEKDSVKMYNGEEWKELQAMTVIPNSLVVEESKKEEANVEASNEEEKQAE